MLREDGRSVYIEKGRLIRAPARSLLRVTEPDKSRVTYPDSTPFARTGFFGTFPKQKRILTELVAPHRETAQAPLCRFDQGLRVQSQALSLSLCMRQDYLPARHTRHGNV